ncbi:MAG TPA: dephospho-CoA kinase [Polyangia bacterium]|nr:dephospho-CoA kinase [Polyangia bacterium]
MRVIGLTGGIASGKSTVARLLADHGAPIVDADQLARAVVAPGQPALDEIARAFGRDVIDASGGLDRKKVAALVFADPDKRRALNAILHPRIGVLTAGELGKLRAAGAKLAIYEAALLVENQIHLGLDGLIVVALDEARQRERLAARDGLAPDEVDARLRAQAPLADKLAAATWIIDNNGPLDDTRRQVDALWEKIRS